MQDTKIGRLMKKIAALQFSQDPHHIVDRSARLIQTYKALMEKAQENGEGSSPTERQTGLDLPAHADSRLAGLDHKPKSVASEAVNTQLPLITNHVLDVPPTPESVVAAVAAIVETNTLAPSENTQRIVTEATTNHSHDTVV